MSHTRLSCTELVNRHWFGPLLVAVITTCAVLSALDPAGDYPAAMAAGPGLTVDEIFNVERGQKLADRLLTGDFAGAIKVGQSLPDHPPLGRLWLGLFHEATLLIAPPRGPHGEVVIAAARAGSAVALGILIWLIGNSTSQWFGRFAGWTAAISLACMPRVFGHAHLAALETVLNLTYAVAIISVARSWTGERAPTLRSAAWCGLWFGLALLTKIQAIFIPIPIAVWALFNWRQQALLPLFVYGLTGLLIFFCGWPWLWLDPVGHFLQYLGHASTRTTIYVWYFGQSFADKQVPWHYPWVLFGTTVPLGLHLLGLCGAWTGVPAESVEPQPFRLSIKCLLLSSILFPLCVFTIPGTAVYDGERLFLIVYPLWAVLIGCGFSVAYRNLAVRIAPRQVVAVLSAFLLIQSFALWRYAPCWLSYYNVSIGGLAGAEKLGLQITYWGDGVTRELWQKTAANLPAGSAIDIVPVLHPFQIPAYQSQCPALREADLKLQPYRAEAPADFLIMFSRREYLPDNWKPEPPGYKRLAVIERQGIVLAGLYQRENIKP